MTEKVMTFTEHLEELRKRLVVSLLAFVVCTVGAYFFSEQLFVLLARPLLQAWAEAGLGQPRLHFANPIEPLFTYLKVALLGGCFAAAPIVFYQLWLFIGPGLKRTERRYVVPFTLLSSICFIGGACFGYFIVFPQAFRFFLGYAQQDVGTIQRLFGMASTASAKVALLQPTLMMSEYFGLVWRLLVAFGIVFELPLVISFLALAGLVTRRSLWKWNPYFIVIAFIIGGVLTPGPDVLTQSLMALPLIVLYNLSVILAWIFERRRAGKAAATRG